MNRQIALLTAMMASAALAQSAATSNTTVIGEVTLTRPAADTQTPAPQAAATQTTVEPLGTPLLPEAPLQEQVAPQETVEAAPVQPTQAPVQPAQAQPAQQTQTAPAPIPVPPTVIAPPSAPAQATPAPAQAAPAQAAPTQAAPVKPAASATQVTAPKPAPAAKPTSTAAQATPTAAPSNLPAGWRHLSGDIFGSKSISLPAGSKVQVAIEAVNRATGQHMPHLLVDFSTEMLPTEYYINYNPARMNTAQYDYVVQAKVFSAGGKMLYMSDARQPLPSDVAAKLKIDMQF